MGKTEFPLLYYLFALLLGESLVFASEFGKTSLLFLFPIAVVVFILSRKSVSQVIWVIFLLLGILLESPLAFEIKSVEVEYTGYVTSGGTGIAESSGGKILVDGAWKKLNQTVQIRLSDKGQSVHPGQIIWTAGKLGRRGMFPVYYLDSVVEGVIDGKRILSLPAEYTRDKLKEYGLIKTMAASVFIGDRRSLDYETRERVSDLGVAHLFAVSGLHVGIMYFFLNSTFGLLLIGRNTRLILSVVVLGFYTLATGPSISATRTFLMLLIYSAFRLVDFYQHPLNVLGLTGMIMVCVQPSLVSSLSFQLSFFATAVLLIFLPVLEGRNLVFQAFFTGLVAQIAVIPLSISYFGTLSLLSVPLTVLMVPFFVLPSYIGILSIIVLDALQMKTLCDFFSAGLSSLSQIFERTVLFSSRLIPVFKFESPISYIIALLVLSGLLFSLWHCGQRP